MQIKKKLEAPFGTLPWLRLQYVDRWNIIRMNRKQSVAEHTYNVMIIADHLCSLMNATDALQTDVMAVALYHDRDEVYTGDIPGVVKVKEGTQPVLSLSEAIVKLADLVEAYRYVVMHCNEGPDVMDWVLDGLREEINKMTNRIKPNNEAIKFVGKMMQGDYSYE